MKRYVKEFANDEMKSCTEERKVKIQHVLEVYEKGLITSLEAVKMICDTYYEEGVHTNIKICAHCKKEFTKDEIEFEEFEVIDDETYCYECLDNHIKMCVCCGKYIVPENNDYKIINGDRYCSECVGEYWGRCQWCDSWVPGDELAWYGSILCCNECAENEWEAMEDALGWR